MAKPQRERCAQLSFLLSISASLGAFLLTLDQESLAADLADPALPCWGWLSPPWFGAAR